MSPLLYLAAGVLMALAFPLGPPFPGGPQSGVWVAGWICLAPLLLASARARSWRTAALGGLAAGLTAFVPILAWMYPFLMRWGMLSWIEAGAVFLLLVTYVSSYVAAFAALVRLWTARLGAPVAILLAPAAWVGLELARGVLFTGFPWCLLGYSQAGVPIALQVAELGGVYAVSFLLASAGSCLAAILGGPPARRTAVAAALVPVLGLLYGAARVMPADDHEGGTPVALVQANIAQSDKWDPLEAARIEADHARLTRQAAAEGARLVVWSESSVPLSITHHPPYARRLVDLAAETGADLLVGTVVYETRDGVRYPYNSAYAVGPEGIREPRYDKQHLVPFGEYVPLKRLLFFVEPLVEEAGDFQAGRGGTLLDGGGLSLGTLICYEAIFPGLTRAWVRRGAEAIVNITNDAWYGNTAMPRQHLAMSILRAVESRRWLLRCANTGLSALVDPWGRVTAITRLEEPAVLAGSIPPVRGTTPYAVIGDAFAIACAILAAVSLLTALTRRRARVAEIRSERSVHPYAG